MLELSKKYPKKRAFITGAGAGLGKALSLILAKEGWTIGMSDIRSENLDPTVKEAEAAGGNIFSYLFDVSNRSQFKRVADEFIAKNDGIDVLINNAGVGDGGAFHEYDLVHWDWMIGINQWGVIHGCYYFVKQFQAQKSGHIINIASAAAFAHPTNMSAYNTSKAAVRAFSKTLYYELDYFNVMVSAVMPTFFKTNIMSDARGSSDAIKFGRKMIEKSGIEASVIAEEILVRAGKGEQEIILPKEARRAHFMSRFFPKFLDKQIMRLSKSRRKRKS